MKEFRPKSPLNAYKSSVAWLRPVQVVILSKEQRGSGITCPIKGIFLSKVFVLGCVAQFQNRSRLKQVFAYFRGCEGKK
jgi:hypothetical protein